MQSLPLNLQSHIFASARVQHLVDVHGTKDAALAASAGKGEQFDVKKLLADGAAAGALRGLSLLAAAKGGHIPVVMALLKAGAFDDSVAAKALCTAAHNNHAALVIALLEARKFSPGVAAQAMQETSWTSDADLGAVLALLNACDKPYDYKVEQALCLAAEAGRLGIVRAYVEAGVSYNNCADDDVMLAACKAGHLPIVVYLLSIGSDIHLDEEAHDSSSPLQVAYDHGRYDMCTPSLMLVR